MRATTTQRPAAPPQADGVPVQASPVKLRRRPSMVIWSIALVVLGGVLGLAIWSLSSTSTEVVAVRAAVDRGELITAEDLVVARVAVDPSLRVVPAADLEQVVGQRAVRDLAPGTLLSPDQVGPDVIPGLADRTAEQGHPVGGQVLAAAGLLGNGGGELAAEPPPECRGRVVVRQRAFGRGMVDEWPDFDARAGEPRYSGRERGQVGVASDLRIEPDQQWCPLVDGCGVQGGEPLGQVSLPTSQGTAVLGFPGRAEICRGYLVGCSPHLDVSDQGGGRARVVSDPRRTRPARLRVRSDLTREVPHEIGSGGQVAGPQLMVTECFGDG